MNNRYSSVSCFRAGYDRSPIGRQTNLRSDLRSCAWSQCRLLLSDDVRWVLASLIVPIFATRSTNITNLYSSTLTLSTFMPAIPNWKITVIASAIATAFAVAGVMDYFVDFLIFLGIAGTPLAGVYVVDFFLAKKGDYSMARLEITPRIGVHALAAWGIACIFGYLSQAGTFYLTPLSALDSLIVAAVVYFCLTMVAQRITLQGPH